MRHAMEYTKLMDLIGPSITDHLYWGNVCSGFGGKTECEEIIWDSETSTGDRCGKSPSDHMYRLPRHRRSDG